MIFKIIMVLGVVSIFLPPISKNSNSNG